MFNKKSSPQDFTRETLLANRVVAIWPWHTVLMLQCTVQTCADLPHTQMFWFDYLLQPIDSRFQDLQLNWIRNTLFNFQVFKKLLTFTLSYWIFYKFVCRISFTCHIELRKPFLAHSFFFKIFWNFLSPEIRVILSSISCSNSTS